MSPMQSKGLKRKRTLTEKISDDGDFLVGLVIGAPATWCCGFLLSMSGGMLTPVGFVVVAAIMAGLLLLHYFNRRGQLFIMYGTLASMAIVGLIIVGSMAAQ